MYYTSIHALPVLIPNRYNMMREDALNSSSIAPAHPQNVPRAGFSLVNTIFLFQFIKYHGEILDSWCVLV